MEDEEVNITTVLPVSKLNPSANLTCQSFDENQCHTIMTVKRIFASISLIGCIFVIIVIWLFRKYICLTQRLILYLSISALLNVLLLLLDGLFGSYWCPTIHQSVGDLYPDGGWCNFLGWGITFTDWMVLLWVCCITFNLYMSAIKMKRVDKLEWAYHMICWGIPFILACLPLIDDMYGPAGAWCWIEDWKWRFGIWYCPMFILIIALVSVYTYIIVRVNMKVKRWEGTYDPDVERQKQMLKEDVKPLKLYPFVYLALSVFPLINRIQNAVHPDDPVFALVLLHAMSSPLQGALNAVVFGMDKETRSKLNWSEIKLAYWSHKHRSKSTIQEYDISQGPENPAARY